jgi:hypothetical protein
LFFVGGAPRSGTTWLQQMLDCHPQISCCGEGLFWKHLAVPLDAMMAERRQALDEKNTKLFRHTGGYRLPPPVHADAMLGTAILLALHQQAAGKSCMALGEKTPENVFFFPRLKQIFPGAKLIAIARDPRDVITSAWHFFHRATAGEDETAAKISFIRMALPSMAEGARAMMALAEQYPSDYLMVTYEELQRAQAGALARLFRFLGVSDVDEIVADCMARTSFSTLARGGAAGVADNASFLRKGQVGDWSTTLTQEMNDIVLEQLGWTFPYFGWEA